MPIGIASSYLIVKKSKLKYISGDYLSRYPDGELLPESALDEKFVATSIESFHKALYCLSSRLNNTGRSSRTKKTLDHSEPKISLSQKKGHINQNGSKRTGLDRNENNQNTQHSKLQQGNLSKLSQSVQSFSKSSEKLQNGKMDKNNMLEIISPSSAEREVDCDSRKEVTPIVEVDHTADSPEAT